MSLEPASRAKFNLKDTTVLLVEKGQAGMDILVQIMIGFGVKTFVKSDTIADARQQIGKTVFDLMIIDAVLGKEDGYELVDWLRHDGGENNRFAPVVMITPHTQSSKVAKARDTGAHFVVAKPLTPQILLERILWVAREQRPFVTAGRYCGPDRRFKFEGPPTGTTGRRNDDLSGQVGDAKEPNMSQDQIDALMQPRKVAL